MVVGSTVDWAPDGGDHRSVAFAGCKHDEEEDQILIDTCRCKSDEDESRILYLILRNYLVCVVTLLQWLLAVLTTAMG